MNAFEYTLLTWGKRDDATTFVERLNDAGTNGWEAVGLAPRAVAVPMPGMGADAVPEMIVLMKRLRPTG